MLKGTMYITDDQNILFNIPLDGSTKIISLDEDNVLGDNNMHVIGGTCLLPPMDAKIAEADGNEALYDKIYSTHLLDPYQQQFISALLAFVYQGGKLIFFLPEIGYTNTKEKFIEHMFNVYGLHPGIIGSQDHRYANWYFDTKCIPIWLNMIYMAGVISAQEFLFQYPPNAEIKNNQVMMMLINEVKPYGNTLNERSNYIVRYHNLIHKNPKVVPAILNSDDYE